jgi:predicted dinucleotide-binding enzyme
MRIAVLGTGAVGCAIASKPAGLGHEVTSARRAPNTSPAGCWSTSSSGLPDTP